MRELALAAQERRRPLATTGRCLGPRIHRPAPDQSSDEPKTFPGKGDFDLTVKCAAAPSVPYALLRVQAVADINGAPRVRVARTAVKFSTQDNDATETAPEVTQYIQRLRALI